jgi:hypothetical protein
MELKQKILNFKAKVAGLKKDSPEIKLAWDHVRKADLLAPLNESAAERHLELAARQIGA